MLNFFFKKIKKLKKNLKTWGTPPPKKIISIANYSLNVFLIICITIAFCFVNSVKENLLKKQA